MSAAGVKIGLTAVVVGLLLWWQWDHWGPLDEMKPVKVLLEIDQLGETLRQYREARQEFPPCLAEADEQTRQVRFLKHLERAFPNAHYGRTSADFARLQTQIAQGLGDGSPGYNFQSPAGGELRPIDIGTLDAAEALPFWLAGFPTPIDSTTKRPAAQRKLFGFHRDSDAPLKRGRAATDESHYRSEPLFEFEAERLTDHDGDGWLEFTWRRPFPEERIAPYVYFDGDAYGATTARAELLGTVRYPADGPLLKTWGCAIPYLTKFDPARPSEAQWGNAASFQIVAPGVDNEYGPREADLAERRLVDIEAGRTSVISADGTIRPTAPLFAAEKDNVTNLHDATIDGR